MLILVFLLGILPLFRACLQCDTRIRTLHENFILTAPSLSDQIALKDICDQSYEEYKRASQQRKGVIGETGDLQAFVSWRRFYETLQTHVEQ